MVIWSVFTLKRLSSKKLKTSILHIFTVFALQFYKAPRHPASAWAMDKLQLAGQNVGRVFNFKSGHLYDVHLWCYQ